MWLGARVVLVPFVGPHPYPGALPAIAAIAVLRGKTPQALHWSGAALAALSCGYYPVPAPICDIGVVHREATIAELRLHDEATGHMHRAAHH